MPLIKKDNIFSEYNLHINNFNIGFLLLGTNVLRANNKLNNKKIGYKKISKFEVCIVY